MIIAKEYDNHVLDRIKFLSEKAIYAFSSDANLDVQECCFSLEDGNYIISFDAVDVADLKKIQDFDFHFKSYITLNNSDLNITITPLSVSSTSIKFGREALSCYMTIKHFSEGVTDSISDIWENSYQKAYYKVAKDKRIQHTIPIIFEKSTRNEKEYLIAANILSITIDQMPVDLYYIYDENDKELVYFVIETKIKIPHRTFLKMSDVILKSFALITGNYIADIVYYVASESPEFSNVKISYNKIAESFYTSSTILLYNPDFTVKKKTMISENQYETLCNLLYNNEDLLRASFLLNNSSRVSTLAKASLVTSGLETICKHINRRSNSPKIIEDKTIEKSFKSGLLKVLSEHKEKISEKAYKIFSNKLNQINSIPNSEKLESAFQKVGIQLSEEESYCLTCRNNFAHGDLPNNKKFTALNEEQLLMLVAARLHMLSYMLILKLCGYSGLIVDWGFTAVFRQLHYKNTGKILQGVKFREI